MVGDSLHLLRVECGVSVEDLAREVGVSTMAIEYYEANRWKPGAEVLAKLAKFFGVTVTEIEEGYKAFYDEANHEYYITRHMEGNHFRIVSNKHSEKEINR